VPVSKIQLVELTMDLFITFLSDSYSDRVYNRPDKRNRNNTSVDGLNDGKVRIIFVPSTRNNRRLLLSVVSFAYRFSARKGYSGAPVALPLRNVMASLLWDVRSVVSYSFFSFILHFHFYHYETRSGARSLCEYRIAKRGYVLRIMIINITMCYRVKAVAFAPDGQRNSMRRSRCVVAIIIIIIITC
jgi:hypothetical protein